MANNDWGTPPIYIESARKVMGSIDIDPASNDNAQKIVQAERYFTLKDGNKTLETTWTGNVWMSPPYGRGLAAPFADKVCYDYILGNINQAIILTNNVTDAVWWNSTIGKYATAYCFPNHRLNFVCPKSGKEIRGNAQGQVFAYMGNDVQVFVTEFKQHGLCVVPWR